MLKWFKPQRSPYEAALAMIGVKSGDRVLGIGAAHPRIAAEIARVTGLSGETRVLCAAAHRAALEAAAAEAGALVEVDTREDIPTTPPGQAFDLVVWMEPPVQRSEPDRTTRLRDVLAMLRPGGRIVLIDGAHATGLLKRQASSPSLDATAVVALLAGAGALAARALGTIDGLTYYEARKAR